MNYYIKAKEESIDEFSNKQNKLYHYDVVIAGTTNWKFSYYIDLGLNISDKFVIGVTSIGGNPNSYNFLVIGHGSGVYYICSPAASFHIFIWYFFM